jgi:hypothetical protein
LARASLLLIFTGERRADATAACGNAAIHAPNLHDLDGHPFETTNLARTDAARKVVPPLAARIAAWQERTGDDAPVGARA